MSLSIIEAAAEHRDHPALIRDGSATTFGELAARVRRRMRWLQAQGVAAGDAEIPVALVPSADETFVEFLFALFELGTPALLIHPRLTLRERAALLSGVRVAGSFAAPWPALDGAPHGPDERAGSFDPERALAILYTSGSSGDPKGVVLSRRAFVASAAASANNLGWRADDRWLLGLPPAHVGGLSVLTRCLIARRTAVLTQPSRTEAGSDPQSLAEVIERERVTLLSLVPTQLGGGIRDLEATPAPPRNAPRRRRVRGPFQRSRPTQRCGRSPASVTSTRRRTCAALLFTLVAAASAWRQ